MARGLDPRRKALKQEFTKARGYWNALWNDILDLSPDFFEAYMRFSSIPWTPGVLEPKVKEFVYIAIDASTTHQHEQGLHVHCANALRHGATKEEILEVLQLASAQGINTLTLGMPLLVDEMRKAGLRTPAEGARLSPRQQKLKAKFTETFGRWNPMWADMLRTSPDFFEACLQLRAVPWSQGVLEPRIKELMYIAVDSSTTQLYEPALRLHIRNALAHGATMAEIMEVFQLTAVLGVHAYTLGVPVLVDELKNAGIPRHRESPRSQGNASAGRGRRGRASTPEAAGP